MLRPARLAVNRRGRLAAAVAAAIGFLMLPAFLLAAELPALTGRVVDRADLIDASTEAALTQKLAAFEAKSSDQIVVATIPALDGEAIEPYANRLFRAWGLGQAGDDNGILILVARDDRKMRIEVGYGLEGTLTDLHAKLIIENTMVSAFRAGDFAGGISRAVDDVVLVLEGNAAELEERAARNQESDEGFPIEVAIFFALWATLFFGAFFMAFAARIFGRKIGPGRYKFLGMEFHFGSTGGSGRSWSGSSGSGWRSSSGGYSSGGGGFSGGGGSSGGGGASGSW